MYDPKTGTFSPTGSMTTARSYHTATLLTDGRVLVAGGITSGRAASAEIYDPKTGTFIATGSMTTDRYSHTATLLTDGRVLVAGGYGTNSASTNSASLASADIYDPRAGTFSATGSMTTARGGQSATLLTDGRVLIAGGLFGSSYLASAELYQP
jgi:hypothetical protein